MIKYFKKAEGTHHALGLFILMDEHSSNMNEQLEILVDNRGPKVGDGISKS